MERNAVVYAERAVAETGLDDFGDGAWREGLQRLLEDLDTSAALNQIGRTIVDGEIVAYLTNRLGIVAERRARPEIARREVIAPIVIIGQGRTGTTILYDLLAQDPAMRAPLTWEVAAPNPPPETPTYQSDPRIAANEATSAMVDLIIPGFRAMHPLGPLLAQECVAMTASEFRSMIFPVQYRVPQYTHWLLHEADMAPAYEWHRVFLQHLQSRHMTARWILKSPGHIWCLGALLAEYPDALLVQTHRDPLRIIASLGSLVSTLRSLASDDTSNPEAAGEFADYILDGLDRSVTARIDGTVEPDRVIDVRFDAFMADPLATVRAVYEQLDLELTTVAEARMRDFLSSHPQDRYGKHAYTFAETGLDEGALRERARRYQEYFDVPNEELP
ncbi:MAG: sulfotransferase family protein [Acidimicrobiia bacterium]